MPARLLATSDTPALQDLVSKPCGAKSKTRGSSPRLEHSQGGAVSSTALRTWEPYGVTVPFSRGPNTFAIVFRIYLRAIRSSMLSEEQLARSFRSTPLTAAFALLERSKSS